MLYLIISFSLLRINLNYYRIRHKTNLFTFVYKNSIPQKHQKKVRQLHRRTYNLTNYKNFNELNRILLFKANVACIKS